MLNSSRGVGCTERELTDERVMPWRISSGSEAPAVRIMAGAATRAIEDLNIVFSEPFDWRHIRDGSIRPQDWLQPRLVKDEKKRRSRREMTHLGVATKGVLMLCKDVSGLLNFVITAKFVYFLFLFRSGSCLRNSLKYNIIVNLFG